MGESVDSDGLALASWRGRQVVAISILSSSMLAIDGTVSRLALPAIARDLDLSFVSLQWVLGAYALAVASIILLGGALGDQLGQRNVLLGGVTLFSFASLGCAAAPSVGWLLAARALEGVGAALIAPVGLAILESAIRSSDRYSAIGIWVALSGAVGAVVPFLGGWLLETTTWRWVYVLAPIAGATVAAVAWRALPVSGTARADRRIDVGGAVLCVVALGALYFGLTSASQYSALTWNVGGSLAAAAVALLALLLREGRATHPMLPLASFASEALRASTAVTFLAYIAINGFLFLVVVELQVVASLGPLAAGAALIPITVMSVILSTRVARLTERIGVRSPIAAGLMACAAGCLLAARFDEDTSYVLGVLPATTAFGVGLALLVGPLTAVALGSLGVLHASLASGINNAVARVAGLLAFSALPLLAGIDGEAYGDPSAFLRGFRTAMWISAASMALGGLTTLLTLGRGRPGCGRGAGDIRDDASSDGRHSGAVEDLG
ncbi:MFS transporter [Alloalcanivorax gelatiniphagus]